MVDHLIITGGAGFIGSNFVRHVLENTAQSVVVVDKLTYAGNMASLETVRQHPRFTFVQADIADGRAVAEIFSRYAPSGIVNLAAETHVDRSIDGPRAFVDTNLHGTFELLEASRRFLQTAEAPAFRFLQVSTDEVYGSLTSSGLFSETTPYAPNSPYAATKAGAEHLVRAYFGTYGVPALITNCSNNYGPYQYPEKLVPLMVLNALDGKSLPIYGDGGNVRDWLYVEDHCRALLTVLQKGRPGEKYNVGGGNERSNVAIVDMLCAALEKCVPAATNKALSAKGHSSYTELKTFVTDRPGHDWRYAIDSSKIQKELGWQAQAGLESGMDQTVAWYVANRGWCDTVLRAKYAKERLGLNAGRGDA